MTCIIGIEYDGKVYIGGDSLVTQGWDCGVVSGQKVFRLGDFLIGCSGSVRMQNAVQYQLDIRVQSDDETDEHYILTGLIETMRQRLKDNAISTNENGAEETDGALLVGYHGKLYEVGIDYSIMRFQRGYDAIGAGGDFALGALTVLKESEVFQPIEALIQALTISGRFSNTVAAPYYVEVI